MKKIIFLLFLCILGAGCSKYNGELIFNKAEPENGFNFPYYLFLPENMSETDELILVVEPNNSGFVSDEFKKHTEKAQRTATNDFYMGNYVAQNLGFPLLVPVFPRPEENWKIYTHALDRDAMLQKNNPLEHIDLQLLYMINDAETRLIEDRYKVNKKVLLTGFSASGTFVNRFTFLHPERVIAAAAGGLNGLLILPKKEMDGIKLNYPLGANDFEQLTGKTWDIETFTKVPQFLFMGSLDDNDAILYDDGYSQEERDIIFQLLGEQMQPKRWENCKHIYEMEKVNATIKTYEGIGHEHPQKIKDEIVMFFKNQINKKAE